MVEEDQIRLDWMKGAFESSSTRCKECGDKNVWDQVHSCCVEQCREHLNGLRSYPLAAWDDVTGAPLDPEKVVAARKLEIQYATRKPVWRKIARAEARKKGWKVIKSRWIDINTGDDSNPIYRSRLVGKEFNDKELDGLFAATPPLEALRLLLSWTANEGG